MNLDLKKVYDRVVDTLLFKILDAVGFPNRLTRWIKILYQDIASQL